MIKRFLFVATMTSAVITGSYAQKIAITKGQKLETQTVTKTTMEVMGQNIDNETNMVNTVEVKDVTGDGYLFSNTINRMVIKGNAMGQEMSFDSDKKEDMDGQIGQTLKGHIGTAQEI